MARGPDATTLLERALAAPLAAFGGTIVESDCVRWASATFVGARHRLVLAGDDGVAARDWLAALPEADWALRGHLVADVRLVDRNAADSRFTATIEILTVEVD
ncbi:hypothetical protein [Sphingomonas qomolangmaensis]|uniref:DUF3168 domain-containing protein n=1 Tax=Sphingomonas qomolangmaensis TaxID=2918765 RepID=A0ABY5L4N8_9SPHN|nr:hypothetical protein [Sphingomonas qomolangmaensis]UUL81457.1 hypothetical protein NMP03_09545 [Sphingomonas qomolangmaensis]